MASTMAVIAKLEADVSNFKAGMAKAEAAIQDLEKKVEASSKDISQSLDKSGKDGAAGFGASIKKLGGMVAGAAAAIGAVNLFGSAINSAVAFEAEFEGVNQVFLDGAKVVQDFAKQAADLTGLSETAALRAAKSFGVFASSAGLAGTEMGKFSTDLVQAAGDLGSFFDVHPEEALAALSSGLRGQFEPLRRFNILIDGAKVEAKAMAMELYNGSGPLSDQARLLATNALMLEGLGVAQGDFVKYQDVYGNSVKTVGARLQEMTAAMGTALLPVLGELTEAMAPLIQELTPMLVETFAALSPAISAITDNLTPLVDSLMPLTEPLILISELFAELVAMILPPFIDVVNLIVPIINNLVGVLEPLIRDGLELLGMVLNSWVVPALEVIAGYINAAVIPTIKFFADLIQPLIRVLMGLAQVFSDYVTPLIQDFAAWVNSNLPQTQAMFEQVFEAIGQAVEWTWKNVLEPMFGWLANLLNIDMSGIGKSFKKGFEGVKETSLPALAEAASITPAAANAIGSKVGTALGTSVAKSAGGAMKKANPWKDFMAGLEDEAKKYAASGKLEKLGISEALIDKILAGADWEKVYDRIIRGGQKTVDQIEKIYYSTEAGINELKKKLEEATKALEDYKNKAADYSADLKQMFESVNPFASLLDKRGEFEKQVADTFTGFYEKITAGVDAGLFDAGVSEQLSLLTASYEQQLKTIAIRVDAINTELERLYQIREAAKAFKEGMADLLASTRPLPRVEAEIGRFEQQVIGSFDAINDKIEEGLRIGLISDTVASQLRASASASRTLLTNIAKQRDSLAKTYDELVQQLNASKDFRQATKNALMGVANITTIGKSARSMIRNLSKTVERTNRFRDQLAELQALGLNREAYNQIVNSGLDAGTATAKAILRGGPEAIQELNRLFGQLEISTEALSRDAEVYMFDGGEERIQSFIDGVLAQDEALRLTAEAEAMAFNASFQTAIDSADTNLDGTIAKLEAERESLIATATSLATAFAAEFTRIVNEAFAAAQAKLAEAQALAAAALAAAQAAQAEKIVEKAADVVKKTDKVTDKGKQIIDQDKGTVSKLPIIADRIARDVNKPSGPLIPASPTNSFGRPVIGTQVPLGGGVYINVNAGIGTNGAAVGKQVAQTLTQYTKTSGKVAI